MRNNRIITIEGVQICVDDLYYDYYWWGRRHGEDSDEYKMACRRILGLGPNDHIFNPYKMRFELWGGNADSMRRLAESPLIQYVEEMTRTSNDNTGGLSGAAATVQVELALKRKDSKRRRKPKL